MAVSLFNPFDDMIFEEQFCFLTGDLTTEKMSVFPEWLLAHFKFADDRIEMMDKTKVYRYKDLQLPCSPRVKKAFDDLEQTFRSAYENGYEGMAALEDRLLFLWAGRIVYGMLYYEMQYETQRLRKMGESFELSDMLKERFGNFHLMLQSIVEPIEFSARKPWSIVLFPLKYSADIVSYRDDTVNLLFQFGVNGFGFIACLQDNGVLADRESKVVEQIKGHTLHPIQFEELFARFHYADYILQYHPQYEITETQRGLFIEALPVVPNENRPLFGFWDEDMFAQLLANYWSVYGITREEIFRYPRPVLSYLQKPYTAEFINPESISLPW